MAGEHYSDGKLPEVTERLSDEAYSTLLDTVVIACVDTLIRDEWGQVLLGLRSRDPHPDWWLFGGRMRRGDSFAEAAAENIRRELGLTVPAERFRYVGTYSTTFARRAQAPAENGTHTVNSVCELVLTSAEVAAIVPDDEYREIAWRTKEEVLANTHLHPLLAQVLRDAARER